MAADQHAGFVRENSTPRARIPQMEHERLGCHILDEQHRRNRRLGLGSDFLKRETERLTIFFAALDGGCARAFVRFEVVQIGRPLDFVAFAPELFDTVNCGEDDPVHSGFTFA